MLDSLILDAFVREKKVRLRFYGEVEFGTEYSKRGDLCPMILKVVSVNNDGSEEDYREIGASWDGIPYTNEDVFSNIVANFTRGCIPSSDIYALDDNIKTLVDSYQKDAILYNGRKILKSLVLDVQYPGDCKLLYATNRFAYYKWEEGIITVDISTGKIVTSYTCFPQYLIEATIANIKIGKETLLFGNLPEAS